MSEPWEAEWCPGEAPEDAPRWEPADWPCEEAPYRREAAAIDAALDELLGNAGA